ncbi:MAG: ATP-binding cassette domain-containing protein [Bacteroidota bacterium]
MEQIATLSIKPLTRLRNMLKVDKKDITQVYVYALFNGMVTLSLPLGIQAIVNLIQGGSMSTAWVILVSVVLLGVLLTGIFQLLQLRIVENLSQKIFSRAAFEFAYRIPRIKSSALHKYYAPELTNRFFDTMTIQKGLPKILIDFSLALFQIVVGLFVLSFYHSFFVLYSIILIVLIYVIIAFTGPKGVRTSLKESSTKYKIAFWLEEIARTKLSFKLMGDSDLDLKKSDENVSDYLEARESHFKVLVNQFSYLVAFKVLIAAGLLITGGILVFEQQMNIGQFVAAEIIIILILASVEKLITTLDSIYDVLAALEKIGYVTDMPLDYGGQMTIDTSEGIDINVENLCYNYPDRQERILKNLNFDLPRNESAVITGPSGSGKSTLIQLLAGISEPSSGLVRFNDMPLKTINKDNMNACVGFSLSDNDVFQGSILDNIVMGRDYVSLTDVKNAIKIAEIDGFVRSQEEGLYTIIDPEGSRIPRSVRNKLLLARAIAPNPKLLILEDPLDHLNRRDKESVIKNLTASDKPWHIIVATVDEIWKQYVQKHIVLDQGEIMEIKFK